MFMPPGIADQNSAELARFQHAKALVSHLTHLFAELPDVPDIGQIALDLLFSVLDDVRVGRVRGYEVDAGILELVEIPGVTEKGLLPGLGSGLFLAQTVLVGRKRGFIAVQVVQPFGRAEVQPIPRDHYRVRVDVDANPAAAGELALNEGRTAAHHLVQDGVALIGISQNQVGEVDCVVVPLFSKIQVVILSPTFSKYPEPLETPHKNPAGPSSDVQVSFPTPPYNISPFR